MKSVARLALLLFAAAAAGCDSPCDQLDSHELTRAAKSLESLSAEAELLAHELGGNSVTLHFAWVHQDALEQESLKVARQLAKPAPDGLRFAQQRELALNTRLQTGLGQVAKAAGQPAQLAQLEQHFHRVNAEVKALETRR